MKTILHIKGFNKLADSKQKAIWDAVSRHNDTHDSYHHIDEIEDDSVSIYIDGQYADVRRGAAPLFENIISILEN